MTGSDIEPGAFREALLALLCEFVGKRRASNFFAVGNEARIIADSGIDLDDQADFWEALHNRLNIRTPWECETKTHKTFPSRLLNVLIPEKTYVFPDLTVAELRRVADAGHWPEGVVQVEVNRPA